MLKVLLGEDVPFGCLIRCDRDVDRYLADYVHQHADSRLRIVCTLSTAERPKRFGQTLQRHMGTIHGQDPSTSPTRVILKPGIETLIDASKEACDEPWVDLRPCPAERRRRPICRQLHARSSCVLPECLDLLSLTAAATVANHMQEKGHHQLWSQRAAPRKATVAKRHGLASGALSQRRNLFKNRGPTGPVTQKLVFDGSSHV